MVYGLNIPLLSLNISQTLMAQLPTSPAVFTSAHPPLQPRLSVPAVLVRRRCAFSCQLIVYRQVEGHRKSSHPARTRPLLFNHMILSAIQ